ncbi:MAG TPA: MBL fold metallo-hydrolase [Burkholderiales bacterium]|nr:MBL fold metallo-hydrolase [Burkholderiales bacterium]
MKRLLLLPATLLAVSCASGPSGEQDLVNKAVNALGGEAALGQLRTVSIAGNAKVWEYASSYQPADKPRDSAEAKFQLQRDLASGAARIDWDRTVLRTPKPERQTYSEILAGGVGYVHGIDSQQRTEFSMKSNPPGHPMSAARNSITQRELLRQSPRLLLEMKVNPGSVKHIAAQTAGDRQLPAVQYDVRNWSFIVMFDPQSGLPARIRTRDFDPVQGDSNYDLALGDWRSVGGVRVAHSLTYKLNERDLIAIKYDQVTANPALSPQLFEIPTMARAVAVRAAMGNDVPYQWMIRRGYWGNLLDSDGQNWDTAKGEPQLVDIAPGVSQTRGTPGNSLVVEMDTYLIVFDAPTGEVMSEWTIRAAKKKYSNKPIRYLMVTHHHWDHANGARTYVAEGATVIVGKGNKEHFARMFTVSAETVNDRLQRNPHKAVIIEVTDKHVVSEGKRQVGAYYIDHSHSTGTLIFYVPDARLGFATDIWSPGREPLPPKPTKGLIELVDGVKKHGLNPATFAGGHGTTGNYAELAKLVGN